MTTIQSVLQSLESKGSADTETLKRVGELGGAAKSTRLSVLRMMYLYICSLSDSERFKACVEVLDILRRIPENRFIDDALSSRHAATGSEPSNCASEEDTCESSVDDAAEHVEADELQSDPQEPSDVEWDYDELGENEWGFDDDREQATGEEHEGNEQEPDDWAESESATDDWCCGMDTSDHQVAKATVLMPWFELAADSNENESALLPLLVEWLQSANILADAQCDPTSVNVARRIARLHITAGNEARAKRVLRAAIWRAIYSCWDGDALIAVGADLADLYHKQRRFAQSRRLLLHLVHLRHDLKLSVLDRRSRRSRFRHSLRIDGAPTLETDLKETDDWIPF